MRRFRLGMRWWLALAFASIAALTSLVVAGNALHSSSQSLRGHAQDLAIGNSVGASNDLVSAIDKGTLNQEIKKVAAKRRLSLFAFDRQGSPVTSSPSYGVDLPKIPSRVVAVSTALGGDRFIHSAADGSSTLVALPLRRHGVAVILAYSPRPDVATELDIVKRTIVESALIAVLIGAVAGIVVAILIVRRLRRIGAAARAIAGGDFDVELEPQWRDELGELAATIDRMRQRLRETFEQLASEHHRLEDMLERLHEGVVLVDRDLSVGYANGCGATDPGRRLAVAGRPAARPVARAVAANARRRPVPRRRDRVRGARRARIAEHTYSVVGIPVEPGVETTVLVLTDVSERERRERAEREFVTNAAHELRTPLAAIGGAVEVLQSGAKDDARRARPVPRPHRARVRAPHPARPRDARARPRADAGEAPRLRARPAAGPARGGRRVAPPVDGVAVDVECADDLTAVLADRDLARAGARQPRRERGKHTDTGEIVLAARTPNGGRVAIEVADTGSGIAGRAIAIAIFDRFYRARQRDGDGFGLGLAIVRAAVQALGGTLEIESEPDSGTTRAHRPPGGSGRTRDARSCRGDDEPAILDAVGYALRGEGFEVEAADDGERGARAARSAALRLLLLDVMLPRLSGTEVCRTLRGRERRADHHAHGADAEVDRVLGLELGADDYVTKPFSIAELMSRVRALLRRRELDRARRAPRCSRSAASASTSPGTRSSSTARPCG